MNRFISSKVIINIPFGSLLFSTFTHCLFRQTENNLIRSVERIVVCLVYSSFTHLTTQEYPVHFSVILRGPDQLSMCNNEGARLFPLLQTVTSSHFDTNL